MLYSTKPFRTGQTNNFSSKSHNNYFRKTVHFPERKLIVLIFCLLSHKSFGGNDNYPSGAREAGMANASVTLTDLWSNFHNQAGLAWLDAFTIGIHYENRYMVDQYALRSFALAIPTSGGTIGASYSVFGYTKYNESKTGLAFGKSFGEKLAAGIQMDYLHVHIDGEYGNSDALTMEAGIVAKPVTNLFVGAHVYNPVRAKYNRFTDEPIPTVLQVGLGYYFSDDLVVCVESEKDLDREMLVNVGSEYHLVKSVYLRAGLSTSRISSYSFGAGFVFKGLKIDLAFSDHSILGLTPHISMSYSF